MAASLIVSTAVPGPGHRRAAAVTVVLLVLAACLIMRFGTLQLAPRAGFLPTFGGMMLLGDLITAVLLFGQAGAARDRSTADLATAYLFSSAIIVPHLMAFPGLFADGSLIGDSASAVWLWCVWHAGFALCVTRYAWRRGRAGSGPIRLSRIVPVVGGVVIAAALVTTVGLPWLPDVLQGGAFVGLNRTGIGPFVALCNVVALTLVVVLLRARTVVDLWLVVVMLAATIDVVLTLYGGGRYTLGWYAARVLSLCTGITILVALLAELTTLFGRLSELNVHLQFLSVTDGLTQIANRRGFDEALERAWRDAEREETAISLLIVDIDHFKGFNDSYGHPAGDECLRRVASLINGHARRPYDVAARLGGEEFALLMPRTEEAGAAMIAARLRAGIEGLMIPNAASRLGHVTISGGIATLRPLAQRVGAAVLTEAADQALYRAKQRGRNRVTVFDGAAEVLGKAVMEVSARRPEVLGATG